MKIKGLAHVAFNVASIERSLDFYCGKLGMRQVFSMTYADLLQMLRSMAEQAPQEGGNKSMLEQMAQQLLDKKDLLWMTYLEFAPGQFIELFATESGALFKDRDPQKVGYQHFALEVEDIQEARASLIAAGVPILRDASLGPDHTWQLWLTDPDGNEFELHQYTPASLQYL